MGTGESTTVATAAAAMRFAALVAFLTQNRTGLGAGSATFVSISASLSVDSPAVPPSADSPASASSSAILRKKLKIVGHLVNRCIWPVCSHLLSHLGPRRASLRPRRNTFVPTRGKTEYHPPRISSTIINLRNDWTVYAGRAALASDRAFCGPSMATTRL